MDDPCFDDLARGLCASSSRRDVYLGLASGLLVGLPLALTADGGLAKRKRKRKKKKKKSPPPPPPPPPSPPAPEIAYQCPGPPENNNSTTGDNRRAQLFTASRSGTLRQIQVAITKAGTAGDYLVQMLKVSAGIPGNTAGDVIASLIFPDATVPGGDTTLVANFAGPQLVQSTDYAVAITRPGSDHLAGGFRLGNACTGALFNATSTGAFVPGPGDRDLIVTVLVV